VIRSGDGDVWLSLDASSMRVMVTTPKGSDDYSIRADNERSGDFSTVSRIGLWSFQTNGWADATAFISFFRRRASVKRRLVCEGHICFAHCFPHIPDPSRVGREKDSIARPYFHLLAAFRCEEAVAGDEMAQLRLFHLARTTPRACIPTHQPRPACLVRKQPRNISIEPQVGPMAQQPAPRRGGLFLLHSKSRQVAQSNSLVEELNTLRLNQRNPSVRLDPELS
jgi:hypothetical protein